MVQDPEGVIEKWRASKVILSPRRDLGCVKTWKWLIQQGFPMDTPENRFQILKYLVRRGKVKAFKVFFRKDDSTRFFMYTLLDEAVRSGSLRMVKAIPTESISQSDLDAALSNAANYQGYTRIVQYLHGLGASLSTHKPTPLLSALWVGDLKTIKYLVENGATTNPDSILMSAGHSSQPITKYLIKHVLPGLTFSPQEAARVQGSINPILKNYLRSLNILSPLPYSRT